MRSLFRLAVFFVLIHFLATAQSPDKAAKIDQLARQYADCCQFTGTVLVSEHDKVIFKGGYGLANREWNIPNAPDVKFRVGSITKQFTSMLVLQQVAKGSIKLDGHISDYLPYYRKDTGSRVTIAQLLSHTPASRVTPTTPNSSRTSPVTITPSTISSQNFAAVISSSNPAPNSTTTIPATSSSALSSNMSPARNTKICFRKTS